MSTVGFSALLLAIVVAPALGATNDSQLVFQHSTSIAVRDQKVSFGCTFNGDNWKVQITGVATLRRKSVTNASLVLFKGEVVSEEFTTLCSSQCSALFASYKYDAAQPTTLSGTNGTLVQPHLWHIENVNAYATGDYSCDFTYKTLLASSKPLRLEVAEVRTVNFANAAEGTFDLYVLDPRKAYPFSCTAQVTVGDAVKTSSYSVRVFLAEKSDSWDALVDVTSNFTVTAGSTVTKVPDDAGSQFSWLKAPLTISGMVSLDPNLVNRYLVCAVRPSDATVLTALKMAQLTDAQRAKYEVRDAVLINRKGVDPDKDPVQFNCTQHHGAFYEGESVQLACTINQYGYDVNPNFVWTIRNRQTGADFNCTNLNLKLCQGFLSDVTAVKFPMSNDPIVSVSLALTVSALTVDYSYTLSAEYSGIRTFRTDNFTISVKPPPTTQPVKVAGAAESNANEPFGESAEVSKLSGSSNRAGIALPTASILIVCALIVLLVAPYCPF